MHLCVCVLNYDYVENYRIIVDKSSKMIFFDVLRCVRIKIIECEERKFVGLT